MFKLVPKEERKKKRSHMRGSKSTTKSKALKEHRELLEEY